MTDLFSPAEMKQAVAKRFANKCRDWLDGKGTWPQSFPLGRPTEGLVLSYPKVIAAWVEAWTTPPKSGSVEFEQRFMRSAGAHRLPGRLVFSDVRSLAVFCGMAREWDRVVSRVEHLNTVWPGAPGLWGRLFSELTDLSESDFEILVGVAKWLEENPDSGLFARQLWVPGAHTKWLESHTRAIRTLMDLVGAPLQGCPDFFEAAGLRTDVRPWVRIRVLCRELREQAKLGGLDDFTVLPEAAGRIPLRPRTVIIVENHTTGAALPEIPGAVAIVGLGRGASATSLSPIGWLQGTRLYYWGDIDTWGLVILSQVLQAFPSTVPILMDRKTFLRWKPMWTVEKEPNLTTETSLPVEQDNLLKELRTGVHGQTLRLEQEFIPWDIVLGHLDTQVGLQRQADF